MIRFAVIDHTTLDEFIDNIQPLLELHYQELTLDKDIMTLKPNWPRYRELMALDKMAVMGAYENDKLVGYSVFFKEAHIHYDDNIIAKNDVLFLHPNCRQGITGIKLIKASEEMLQHQGVSKVIWHVKHSRDFRNILYRMGYKDEDVIVGKALRRL